MAHATYNTLAVLSCTAQSINFYDISTGEKTSSLNGLIAEPHELLFDSRRGHLYASHFYRRGRYGAHQGFAKEISVIDANKKVVGVIDVSPSRGPHDMALDVERDLLWISVEEMESGSDGGLVAIDLATWLVVKSISCKAPLHWFVVTPDGRKAYTANRQHAFISILDLEQERMTGTIPVSEGCEEPDISPDGRLANFPTPGLRFGHTPNAPRCVWSTLKAIRSFKPFLLAPATGPSHISHASEVLNLHKSHVITTLHMRCVYVHCLTPKLMRWLDTSATS